MISLMVVDDEEIIIRGIRSILKRSSHGYVMVGEAVDGRQAIEVAKQVKPDLIITDICMPEVNGLEMIGMIREALPEVRFIILSGYGEFEYAQEAVRLGVIDYLLKPISSSGLYAVLDRVAQQLAIAESRKNDERKNQLEKLMGEYIFSGMDDNLSKIEDILGKNAVYHLEVFTFGWEKRRHAPEDVRKWISSYIEKGKYGIAFGWAGGMVLLLEENGKLRLPFLNSAISDGLADIFEYNVLIDEAGETGDLKQARELYRQAMLSASMRFYEKESFLYRKWDGVEVIPMSIEMLHEDFSKRLLEWIQARQQDKIDEIIGSVIEKFKKEHIKPEDLDRYMQGVMRICISDLRKKGYLQGAGLEILDEKITHLNSCGSGRELRKNILAITDLLSDLMSYEAGSTTSHTISEIKQYIDENYQKSIGLTDAAEIVFLSPKYLSDLFRRETGESFLTYLTKVRMENAKRILGQRELKIYEVAESVGYHNSKTFVKVFKKVTGMTPMEYRNKN